MNESSSLIDISVHNSFLFRTPQPSELKSCRKNVDVSTYNNDLGQVELCVLSDSPQYILQFRRDWNQLIHGAVVVSGLLLLFVKPWC